MRLLLALLISVQCFAFLTPRNSGSGGATWGSITGTLSAQTDLQNALNAKASLSGATNGQVLYDNSGVIGSFGSWNGSVFTVPNLIDSGLTASQLVQTNGSKQLSSTTSLPNGTTATTQSSSDNSTQVATDAFVQSVFSTVPTQVWQQTGGPGTPITQVDNTAPVQFSQPIQNTSNNNVLDTNNGILSDYTGAASLYWINSRALLDSSGTIWEDWSGGYNPGAFISFGLDIESNHSVFFQGTIGDNSTYNAASINPNLRLLYRAASTDIEVDYSGGVNASAILSFDGSFQAAYFAGAIHMSGGNGLYFDTLGESIYGNTTGSNSIQVMSPPQGLLMDTPNSNTSLNWFLRRTTASNGSTVNGDWSSSSGWSFPVGVSSYKGVSTVASGLPSIVAQANLTTQAAAISATTIYAVPAAGAGFYRVCYVSSITRAASTSSVLGGTNGFQVVFTDANDSVVKTSANAAISSSLNTTATSIGDCLTAYAKASTNLQYSFGYTSVGVTTMQYDLSVRVEPI